MSLVMQYLPCSHQHFPLPGPESLPGESVTLDSQCYADMGTRACYSDYRVCSQLFCYNSHKTQCVAHRPAVEGSPCGHQRFCQAGRCVTRYSSQATITVKNSQVGVTTSGRYSKTTRYSYPAEKSRKTYARSKKGYSEQSQVKCVDSSRRQGSLSCFSIFSRYSAIYCYRNMRVQRACCLSYRTFCSRIP